MRRLPASSSRAQIKIQEMAFVLVAFAVFFVIAGLFYFSVKIAGGKGDIQEQREQEARELIRSIAESAEFRWSSSGRSCKGCVDLDKAILLKDEERRAYQELWNLDHLRIETIYPREIGECNRNNYPNCRSITIINKSSNYALQGAFVALCRWDSRLESETCFLGKIFASAKEIR